MTTPLAVPEPDVTLSTTFTDIDAGSFFSYALYSDWTSWQTWEVAVLSGDYSITDIEWTNIEKYSAFILQVKVYADEDYDGGCFNTADHGAICFAYLTDTIRTYRHSETSWEALKVSLMDGSNTDFTDDIIDNADALSAMEYMDYAGCQDDDADDYWECKMWQPNWREDSDGNSPITAGHPRLGTEEVGITAGYSDVSLAANLEDVMESVVLARAAPALLLAGCASVFALAF